MVKDFKFLINLTLSTRLKLNQNGCSSSDLHCDEQLIEELID